ncbi:MAG: 16S rRNA (guanine(966)-N(2))-methyltransferase RsmD [Legionella sp.]
MKQSIRIIGGMHRGKKLYFSPVDGLRPTPDRVRETLFNWLMADIREARCLDAYAGSGALGFEAYSRGASRVVLVEHATIQYHNLNQIAAMLATNQLNVIKANANQFMLTCKEQFDIIFLDPPFASNQLDASLTILTESAILIAGGLVYVESSKKPTMPSANWEELKSKRAGQVYYGLYRKN